MRLLNWTMAMALVGMAAAHSAAASTLTSPQMWPQNNEVILCTIVNVGTTAIKTVTIDVINFGASVSTIACPNLAPGSPCFQYGPLGASGSGYCKAVVSAPKGKVRGVANVRDNNTGFTDYTVPIN